MPVDLRTALAAAAARLEHSSSARLDAELLLCAVLNTGRSELFTAADRVLLGEELNEFETLVEQRQQGMPVAYLLGNCEFWSLPLKVNANVLIPRPETETLVEYALALLPPQAQWKVIDLGTGSGAVAAALAHERAEIHLVATDISEAALKIANDNMTALGLETVKLMRCDWLDCFKREQFDLILANPPYIADEEYNETSRELLFEPPGALYAEDHGLADIKKIIKGAAQCLTAGGHIAFEHGYRQGDSVRKLLALNGFDAIQTLTDIAGHERVSVAQKKYPAA